MGRLSPACARGLEWGRLLVAAGDDVRTGVDHWRIYKIDPVQRKDRLHAIPLLPGPMIYAVLEAEGWYYVGQTMQTLTSRLRSHLRVVDRAIRWHRIMAMVLQSEVSATRLNDLERAGRVLLAPRAGSRWPAA